jgi:hypothetical protein
MSVPTKPNAAAAYISDVRRKIERVPVGPTRTELEIKFARTTQTLARQIAEAARRK